MVVLMALVLVAGAAGVVVLRRLRRDVPGRPAVRRRWVAFAGVIAVFSLQLLMGSPAMAQTGDCAEPPNPERPTTGMVAALDAPLLTHGSVDSRYGKYGYAGMRWYVYDDNCVLSKGLTDPNNTIDTWAGNQLFNIGKNFVAATNGLHYALAYDELMAPLDGAVKNATQLFYDNIYLRWFGLVALILAVFMFKSIWTGDLATVSKRGLWALAAMWTATSFLLVGPVYNELEQRFLDKTSQIQAGFLAEDPSKLEIDAFPDLIHDRVVYRNWLRGEFGSETATQSQQFGDPLLAAQAWTKTDTADNVDQGALEAKKASYKDIAGKLGPATGYFKGTDGSRTGAGFLGLFQGIVYTLFQLFAKAGILLAQVLLRIFLLATPLIGLVGLIYHDILRKVARAAAAVVLNVLILAALAGMHVLLLNAIFNAGTALSTMAQMALAALITVVFLVIGRPMRRMFQMVELSVGAVGAAMPSAGPGMWSKFRKRQAQPPSAQDEFWDTVRGMDPDEPIRTDDGRRPRPEASNPVMVTAERMDGRRRPGAPGGYLPAGSQGMLVSGSDPGGRSSPAAAIGPATSRLVDTAPVSDRGWDRGEDAVIIPSEVRRGRARHRRCTPRRRSRCVRRTPRWSPGGRCTSCTGPRGGWKSGTTRRRAG